MLQLSPTQIADYSRCPYRLYLKQRIRVAPQLSYVKGRAVHDTVRLALLGRQAGMGLTLAQMEQLALDTMDKIRDTEAIYFPPSVTDTNAEYLNAKEEVKAMLGVLYDWTAQVPLPRLLEEAMAVRMGDIEMRGRADMLTERGVIELKTGSRAWSQQQVDLDQQLTAYVWLGAENGLISLTPDAPALVEVVSVTPKKLTILTSKRTYDDVQRYKEVVLAIGEAIGKAVYPPTVEGWLHSPDYCEYWFLCKYGGGKNGGDNVWF